jgi:D-alanyl-D-alanine carboxypeptidase
MKNRVLAPFSRYIAAVMTGVLFCVGAVACASSTSSTPPNSALMIALHQDLANYLNARSTIEHLSTLSMTISFRNGQTINTAVGTTKFGGSIPVTPSNVFQIGSNTKAYTAALILRLEAAGALSINDTLGKWLPQYPAWSNVTIKQLLNMTSGIPTYDLTSAQIDAYGSNPYVEDTLAQLVAYVYPNIGSSPPWLYSNTGYILLEMIINEASPSHSYQTELDKLITTVGLHNSFYQPYFYPSSVTQRLVSGYYENTDPPVIPQLLGTDTSGYSLGWTQAAGGMESTPEDLTQWVRALFEGNILPQQQRTELLSLVSVKTGQAITQTTPSDSQGFGLGIFNVDEPTLGNYWGYQGSTIGYRASYAYFPTTGLIICIFTNSQTSAKDNTVLTVLFPTIYNTLKANGST